MIFLFFIFTLAGVVQSITPSSIPTLTPTLNPTLTNTSQATVTCPSGFKPLSTFNYVQFISSAMSWMAARDNCVALGGWLVTYPSPYDTVVMHN